jgi:hypothetical protein
MSDIGTHTIIDPRAVPEHVYAAAMRIVAGSLDQFEMCMCAGLIWQWLWNYRDPMAGNRSAIPMSRYVLSQAAQYGVAYECKE